MDVSLLLRYLKYYFTSDSRHAVHSPFVYSLVEEIRKDKKENKFNIIENIRQDLLRDKSRVTINDFGAGISREESISSITKKSSKPQKYCRLLSRIVSHYKPQVMLELGTAVGISTMYQAQANTNGRIITIEGSDTLAERAKANFTKAGLNNIELHKGNFNNVLPGLLSNIQQLDYIFFDGNHRMEPTWDYFRQCLSKSHKNTIFVFDDINWNDEMRETWKMIINHQESIVTVDLFMMGLVFLNPELSRQNFIIRY